MTFDHLGWAILTIFQVITLADWNQIMTLYMNSNNPVMSVIFFYLLVIFGTFFILNLIMAVIMESFSKIDQQLLKEKKAQAIAQIKSLESDPSSISKPDPSSKLQSEIASKKFELNSNVGSQSN